MPKEINNPITDAEKKYLNLFGELMENYQKLYKHIKPLIEYDKETLEIAKKINTDLLVLPIVHLSISMANMTQIGLIKQMMPPLKIECPDCKKVIWDITELKKNILKEKQKDIKEDE